MATFFERSAIVIVFCCLVICPYERVFARTLKGTIRSGKYIAPNDRFSFAVPPNAKVEDRTKVMPVAHFYQRAFYPVPSSIEIPRKADWLTVSFQDSRGLSNEICSMPITGDSFTPLSVALHRRTAQRFLQDIAMPEWFSSVSRKTWLPVDMEYMNLDEMEALITTLLAPPEGIKGVTWKPEGAGFHLHFGVLVFIKANYVYMLVQSLANYTLPGPEFIVDSKSSLQEFYRGITFNTDSRPTKFENRTALASSIAP